MGIDEFLRPLDIVLVSNLHNEHEARRAACAAKEKLLAALRAFERTASELAQWSRDYESAPARIATWAGETRSQIEAMIPTSEIETLSALEYAARFGRAFAYAPDAAAALDTTEGGLRTARDNAKKKLGTPGPTIRAGRLPGAKSRAKR